MPVPGGFPRAGRATVFPEPIGLAETWNDGLAFRVATAISDEASAKNAEFIRRGKRNIHQGRIYKGSRSSPRRG
jgi:beta-glucosidase